MTVSSDILKKKIKNRDIVLIAAAAIFLYILFGIRGEIKISLSLVMNPLVALAIGFLLYSRQLWKAGDAKLFALYSLLVYNNKYSSLLPLSCLVIFLNTFLISFICLVPYLVKNIIDNKNNLRKKILSPDTLSYFAMIIGITLSISWVIKPLLSLLPLKNVFFLEFVLIYLGYSVVFRSMNNIKGKRIILVIVFLTGLILRYTIEPGSFQLNNLYPYLKHILQFSFLVYLIRTVIDLEEKINVRIPFAPFMFLGAVLAETDFLKWAMTFLTLIRR